MVSGYCIHNLILPLPMVSLYGNDSQVTAIESLWPSKLKISTIFSYFLSTFILTV